MIKANLLRGACYVLLLLAVSAIPLGFGQRPMSAPSPKDNPAGFVCIGCPSSGWHPWTGHAKYRRPHGWRLLSTATTSFMSWAGRSMDGIGNDFTHPFEYNGTWSIKSATYPDNQVSNMACGILTDSGTNYIYCVGRLSRRADHRY